MCVYFCSALEYKVMHSYQKIVVGDSPAVSQKKSIYVKN
jgi:hypothetical protein